MQAKILILPLPRILYQLTALRPGGFRAMLCAHGAKDRLVGLRSGGWTLTPLNDWYYTIFPGGQVGWILTEMSLPKTQFVPFRNDLH